MKNDCLRSVEAGADCMACALEDAIDLHAAGCTDANLQEVCDLAACITAVDAVGCLKPSAGTKACEQCSQAHAITLEAAGCTTKGVETICEWI